ncbi:MAG: aldo/keto reductase [Coriobacteriales bacterium]|jgi:predicted aldo/keto reductase-like oxidoreductase|nr:aldo/keto reductase [Coriobacteriales bacterium]
MIYRVNPKNKDQISQLGFGCMRFPKDDADVEQQVVYAIEHGVNYFDTAYIYPHNEERLGKVLAKGYRDRVFIATKMPSYLIKRTESFSRMFNTQLKRLQTDHLDYYLIHMLTNTGEWKRACQIGMRDFIDERKASGQISNIGFSYHGGLQEFKDLVDVYNWDFCMLQFNYLDENNQAGKTGLEYAAARGIPVMIMEPLRGGRLAANLPKEALRVWENAPTKRPPAEWGLRWVWNHPDVLTVLSGMNTLRMLKENIRIASDAQAHELSGAERALYDEVCRALLGQETITCTGCNYCMPCPKGVDIPLCFACYNDKKTGLGNRFTLEFQYIQRTYNHQASLCVECGTCEKHCPQSLKIRNELKKVAREMEGLLYYPTRFMVKKIMHLT